MIDTAKDCTSDVAVKSALSIRSSAKKARFLAQYFDNRIKASIGKLTEECSRKLKTPLPSATSLADPHSRLPPQLHYLHHKLQSVMRMQSRSEATLAAQQVIAELEMRESKRRLLSVSKLESSEWERFSRSEGAKLSALEQGTIDTPTSITEKDLERGRSHITEALATIKDIDAELHGEILEHIEDIKLFDSKITQGFSDIRTMGAIFIRPPRVVDNIPLYYFEQLIHETSHLQLHCIFSIDRLIEGDVTRKTISPVRADPRSIFGVYHATYVSAKVSYGLFRLYQRTADKTLLCWLAQTTNELLNGIDIVRRFALTPAGAMLIESMQSVAVHLAENSIWSDFDFAAPMQHRSKGTTVTVNRLQKFSKLPKRLI